MKKSYKPTLSIDTHQLTEGNEYDAFLSEIGKYSITPTTLQSRELLTKKDKTQIIDSFKKQKYVFLEKLETAQMLLKENTKLVNSAIKSQIFTEGEGLGLIKTNQVSNLFEIKINELNTKLKKLEVYEQNIDTIDNSAIYKDLYSNNEGNTVLKHGIELSSVKKLAEIYNKQHNKLSLIKTQGSQTESKKSNKSNKEAQPDILLHPLEVKLIQDAITSLKTSEQKTALIDIFARTDKEDINIDIKTGIPETHTVVLYKNSENEVVIIDPSNSNFSRHIALNTNNELIDGTVRIIAPEKEIKIYSPASKDKIGPNPDQYRDCIDIAVKLAFGLNKREGKIDPIKLAELPVIQEITNQTVINETFEQNSGVVRIRQASEDNVRYFSKKLIDKFNQQLKIVLQYKKAVDTITEKENIEKLEDNIMQRNINALLQNYTYEDYAMGVKDLLTIHNKNQEEINEFLNQSVECLGKEINESFI